jgi:undecaprenyl-diphosphatase
VNVLRGWVLAVALLGPVQAFDDAAREAVQAMRRPSLDRGMRIATDIGKPAIVLGALLGIAVFDAAAGPATARLAIMALLPTNLVVEATKRITQRGRPDGTRRASNAAFPSSHAANAFALAFVLARRWRRLAPAFFALAATVAFSRIYLDRHWTSDVVVGAVLGGGLAWAAGRWLARRAEPPRARTPSPSAP